MADLAAAAGLLPATVLVTGAGGPSGQSAIQALRERGYRVIAVDMRAMESEADAFFTVPAVRDEGFLPSLYQLLAQERVTWLFPTVAEELTILAGEAVALRGAGIAIFLSPVESVANCHDKWRTACELFTRDVAVPQSAIGVEGSPDVEAIGFPRISKPRVGRGGRGVVVHDGPGIATAEEDVIWQRFLPGKEYDVLLMIDPEPPFRPLVARVFEKTALREGRTGNALAVRSVEAPDVAELALLAARALGLTGPLDIDVRRDTDGTPRILEINARIGAHVLQAPEIFDAMAALQQAGSLG